MGVNLVRNDIVGRVTGITSDPPCAAAVAKVTAAATVLIQRHVMNEKVQPRRGAVSQSFNQCRRTSAGLGTRFGRIESYVFGGAAPAIGCALKK